MGRDIGRIHAKVKAQRTLTGENPDSDWVGVKLKAAELHVCPLTSPPYPKRFGGNEPLFPGRGRVRDGQLAVQPARHHGGAAGAGARARGAHGLGAGRQARVGPNQNR